MENGKNGIFGKFISLIFWWITFLTEIKNGGRIRRGKGIETETFICDGGREANPMVSGIRPGIDKIRETKPSGAIGCASGEKKMNEDDNNERIKRIAEMIREKLKESGYEVIDYDLFDEDDDEDEEDIGVLQEEYENEMKLALGVPDLIQERMSQQMFIQWVGFTIRYVVHLKRRDLRRLELDDDVFGDLETFVEKTVNDIIKSVIGNRVYAGDDVPLDQEDVNCVFEGTLRWAMSFMNYNTSYDSLLNGKGDDGKSDK